MSRLPNILPENFTEPQQKLFESITGGKRGKQSAVETFLNPEGGLRGPFNALLFSPILGEAAQRLGEAVRFEGTLSPQLRELAILTVAAKWEAQYEWWAHEKIAREAKLDPNIIAGIKTGVLPESAEPAEVIVYNFARELTDRHQVSDQQYEKVVALLGESGIVELVILIGYYTLISMTLNVFEVPLPPGETVPFA
ncbi:carboxymuconolactone decarboxylase family protein [Chloroflexi bacterium TSY]|nr:carboxymuconolactone decarboxylase family protein [Chloroflexi bacterium TSY]